VTTAALICECVYKFLVISHGLVSTETHGGVLTAALCCSLPVSLL